MAAKRYTSGNNKFLEIAKPYVARQTYSLLVKYMNGDDDSPYFAPMDKIVRCAVRNTHPDRRHQIIFALKSAGYTIPTDVDTDKPVAATTETTETANTMDKAVKPMASKQVTLSETQDKAIEQIATHEQTPLSAKDGYVWTWDIRYSNMNTLKSLEKKGIIEWGRMHSFGIEHDDEKKLRLTDAGREYATAHGWLNTAPVKPNDLHIDNTVKQTGSMNNVAKGDIVVWQGVYARVELADYDDNDVTLYVIDEDGVEHEWTDEDVQIFETEYAHQERVAALAAPVIETTPKTMDKAVKPMAGKQHAGNNKFLAAMKAWHTRHSSLGKMTVTAKNNYSSLVELINRTSEAKAIEFALMRAYGKRDELEAWLIEAGVVAAPTSAETAPEAANAAPVERAGVGDAFYHDMSKDEVFDRLVEYLCEWDFKSIIDEHVESEEEIQIGNIIFQLVCSRAWEIKKQGTTTDTLRAERQTAANGAQDAVSDGKYKRGDLVLHGSTMYTVADEYVYRSGDELVSHYRVESKGSILDAYYLAEELTPATAIATSELERLRSEHATMLKALTDVRYSGEISYRILDIIDPILKQANQEEG
jgi:hypothetical protein